MDYKYFRFEKKVAGYRKRCV